MVVRAIPGYTRRRVPPGYQTGSNSVLRAAILFNYRHCAAKAFYSCPAIISQRLESRIISKEPQENTEEESKII
jgi:hypothetical protein